MRDEDVGGLVTFFLVIIVGLLIFILLTRLDISSQKSFTQGDAVYQCKKLNELVSER